MLDLYEQKLQGSPSLLHPNLVHAREMIPKVRSLLDAGRREEVLRWLGFIQGVLWAHRAYTIEEIESDPCTTPEERAVIDASVTYRKALRAMWSSKGTKEQHEQIVLDKLSAEYAWGRVMDELLAARAGKEKE